MIDKILWGGILFVFLLFVYIMVTEEANAGDLRVGVMSNSHHFGAGGGHDYNERHDGVLFETRAGTGWVGFMHYTNSLEDSSNTLYYQRDIWRIGNVDFGLIAGAVSGYSVSPAPYGALTITVPIGWFRPRLIALPIVIAPQYIVEFGDAQ